jgi:hypothetical protein
MSRSGRPQSQAGLQAFTEKEGRIAASAQEKDMLTEVHSSIPHGSLALKK